MLLPMAPTDSLFLLGESPCHPMHVGGLTLFTPPEGAAAADVRALFEAALTDDRVAPLLRTRARRSLISLGQWVGTPCPSRRWISAITCAVTPCPPRAEWTN